MSGSVSPFPGMSGGDGILPPGVIYRAAVDEHRFQARYNWSRTQYLLGFNVAILAAATAVATRPHGHAAALVFLLGAVAADLSALVVRTQHDDYRAARNRMQRVEADLNVPPGQRLDTTATMSQRRRKLSVNQLVYFLLAVIALADIAGSVLTVIRWAHPP